MNNPIPNHSIRAIFICNKEGKAVNLLAPNFIGKSVAELLADAHRTASEIGGHVEVSEAYGSPRHRHHLPQKTLAPDLAR